ncbi:metallo-beta-lactamase superfamily protein [Nocardia tenerifensis]|uniref:Metallo-beta-lactamase superfamily protein n=1 Tax=Nocardia tenerifensis TaxID=228006 RepID=A0A318KVA3_9NOCA|nr:MBL fold metallo-hydrolase [Nocardia tenerifensis]PXX68661.1 metallo-beta-lactamase superfamily protein [Nocardia tenerifensis]
MRVHHLNCGTMRPLTVPEGLVCHVLLVETDTGLALVDSGLGLRDAADPAGRFGPSRFFVRPRFDEHESAIRQIERLGFDPREVRDIVLTHLDADHSGGLADFPWARVHLCASEAEIALQPRSFVEKGRYLASQRAHDPTFVLHTPGSGEPWRGFAATEELTEIAPGLVMIGLPGHTRGHVAVAVDTGERWILHAGDAFYHRGQIDGSGRAPRALTAMERLVAHDTAAVRANHERLSELWAQPAPDLVLVNAHDPVLLRRARELDTAKRAL